MRVECAKCRQECDLVLPRATLQRSCASSARNAGESAMWFWRGQPSAEIVRVERAKCRRECDLVLSRATLCGDRACRGKRLQPRTGEGSPPPKGVLIFKARPGRGEAGGGRGYYYFPRAPRGERVVTPAKCRPECDLALLRATLCGDRARRVREMQARVRFVPVRDNPLRGSCVSSARKAGQSAICPGRGQPSAGIARVEFVVQL